jgi:biopolymer transport protein ExbD
MKCLLSVCLVATTLAAVAVHSALLQSPAENRAMQKGISVEMAAANNARPWPQADDADAWIVTVDDAGRLYFRADPVTPEGLKQWMIRHPRRREQKLYIKADARALYASVEKALNAANAAEFAAPVLLMDQQRGPVAPGTIVPPKGLEVLIDGVKPAAGAIVVELGASAKGPVQVTINHEPMSWDSLQSRLGELVDRSNERSVFVVADGRATFAQVARVIDACGAARAKGVLSAPTL